MNEDTEKPVAKSKSSTPLEIKKIRWIREVASLAKKLKNTASNHREAAYWEQLEEDLEKAISGPLGS